MTTTKTSELVQFLSQEKSVKLSFNVPVTDSYSNVHEVIIHYCSAGTVRRLIDKGYSLFMTEKGLIIDNYNS